MKKTVFFVPLFMLVLGFITFTGVGQMAVAECLPQKMNYSLLSYDVCKTHFAYPGQLLLFRYGSRRLTISSCNRFSSTVASSILKRAGFWAASFK